MSVDQLFAVSASDVAATADDWYTPRWVFDAAGIVFDVDVCAPVNPAMRTCPAREYLTPVEDGLVADWRGTVWCNPPYSRPAPWIERFAAHPEGIALVPAARSRWLGGLMASADAVALISWCSAVLTVVRRRLGAWRSSWPHGEGRALKRLRRWRQWTRSRRALTT